MIGRRVMGRRVTAPSDRSEPIVARPQLTSKACGARLLVSVGGRHVARREDDKCASYGSLFFIGQSSGTQVETEGKHDRFGEREMSAAAQDDRIGLRQTEDYCAPRRGGSGHPDYMRGGLHLAGQLPAVDNLPFEQRRVPPAVDRQDEVHRARKK